VPLVLPDFTLSLPATNLEHDIATSQKSLFNNKSVYFTGSHISRNPGAISKYLVPEGGIRNQFYTEGNKH
jgi:hypothetical protein